jgi:hypothetical protein
MNPDEILEYLYEEISQFLVTEAGEELENNEIDITLETIDKGEMNIEISLFLEVTAFSKLDVEELSKKAIAYGGMLADKVCPPLVKLHFSGHKS